MVLECYKVLLKLIRRDLTPGIVAHFPLEETFVQSSEKWIRTGRGVLSEHRLGCSYKLSEGKFFCNYDNKDKSNEEKIKFNTFVGQQHYMETTHDKARGKTLVTNTT